MKKAFIRFNSITYAQLAKDVLMKNSIRSQIGRNNTNFKQKSCNYVLYVDGDINKAYEIIERENIKNMGFESGGAL